MTKWNETEIGEIPEDWEVLNLKENCVLIQYGYTATASGKPIGPKFLRGTDIRGYTINWENVPYCRISDNDLDKYKLFKKDIVITRMGTPGDSAYFDADFITVFGSYLIRIRLNREFNSKFVYYFLHSAKYKNFIKGIISTSATPGVNAQHLTNVLIPKPLFEEQKAIAKIFSDLDSKIELNNQMNATLEAMAQAIFKHWFIDFEFPDENGKPYKSSGEKMVDSELGKIPEGWIVGKLKDIIAFKRDKFKQSTEWNHKKLISLSHMPKFSMCVNNFGEGSELNTNIYKLDEYDLLYGSIRPYFGKAGFSPIDGAVAGTVFQFIPNKKEYFGFALLILTSIDFINYTVANSKGTKMPIIDKDDILNYSIIIPSNILNDFNSIVLSLIIRMKNNISQNQILSSIRDSILPKLMSGQIRVPVGVIKNA